MIDIIQLLKVAKCPNCDGSGTIVSSVDCCGEIQDIEQCQWCYERNKIINASELIPNWRGARVYSFPASELIPNS